MTSRLVRFRVNIKKSGQGFTRVFKNPAYIGLALIFAFLISTLIYLMININFYGPLLTSGMAITSKVSVLGLLLKAMVGSYFQDLNGVLLLVLSLLQGIAIALLIYNFRNNHQVDKRAVTGSGIATLASIIGLGCVPCGTSLLVPLIALIFSSSSYMLLNTANLLVLLLASVLSVYSIYKMGLIAHVNFLTKEWKKEASSGDV